MERNNNFNHPKIDKKTEDILKKILKKLERIGNNETYSEVFYVSKRESRYLN